MILIKEGKICMKGNITFHINMKDFEYNCYISITELSPPFTNYDYHICSEDTLICMNLNSEIITIQYIRKKRKK